MISFIAMFVFHIHAPVYPKPMNPGVCRTDAECRQQIIDANKPSDGRKFIPVRRGMR